MFHVSKWRPVMAVLSTASAFALLIPAIRSGPLPTPTSSLARTSPPGPMSGPPGAVPAVACPGPTPPPVRSPRPSPPAGDPAARSVGGSALATSGLAAAAGVPSPPAGVSATSWVVADLDTGAVLGACDAHQYSPPASVQKLLLLATVLPKLDPARVVEVTHEDMNFEPGSSAVGLIEGGRYPVETLVLGLLLNSGNDAANVLARVAGGAAGRPGTIEAMNAEARRLGAYQTHAVTPSGLDGPGQFTSSYDLALIAREDFAREDFRRYVSTRSAQIPAQPPKDPKGFQITNDNQLLMRYPGALGGKTGFTDVARHTFVGAAERNGRRLEVTLVGAEVQPLRGWEQGAALLDWGFGLPREARVGELVAPGGGSASAASRSAGAPSPVGGIQPAAARRSPVGAALLTHTSVAAALLTCLVGLVLLTLRTRTRHRRR